MFESSHNFGKFVLQIAILTTIKNIYTQGTKPKR